MGEGRAFGSRDQRRNVREAAMKLIQRGVHDARRIAVVHHLPPERILSGRSRAGFSSLEVGQFAVFLLYFQREPCSLNSWRAGVCQLVSIVVGLRGRTKERRRNKKARKKALAFVAAIRERRNGPLRSNEETDRSEFSAIRD
jgi:hypothetical protein